MPISETKLMEVINESRRISLRDPIKAFEMAEKARREAEENQLPRATAAAIFAMALSKRSNTDLKGCYEYAREALGHYEAIGDQEGLATVLNLIGVVHFYYGDYDQALEIYIRALELALEGDSDITLSRIYNNIGEVYREVGHWTEALKAYQSALSLAVKNDIKANQAVILQNMGGVYMACEDYEESYYYLQKSYKALLALEDYTALSEVEGKIGKIHWLKGRREEAKACYDRALERLMSLDNKYFSIPILIQLAEYEREKNPVEFIAHLNLAANFGEAIQAKKPLSKIYYMLSEFYEAKNDYDLALDYFKRYHQIEKTLESTMMTQKLEIIKMTLLNSEKDYAVDPITKLNGHLETEINAQRARLQALERENDLLSQAVLLDEVTQVLSRRGIKKRLNEFSGSGMKKRAPYLMMMLDIDHFKRYNDCYGHIQGDECLKQIAQVLSSTLKELGGYVGRYGGEEFVAFVSHISLEVAEALLEEIQLSVQSLDLSYVYEEDAYTVTISTGAVYVDRIYEKTLQEVLAEADDLLYLAKDEGRNRYKLNTHTLK